MTDSPQIALGDIQTILGLNRAELGRLFGVHHQTIDRWYQKAVPLERVTAVERVQNIAHVLFKEIIPERIPSVVRTPAPGLEHRSILQALHEPQGADRVDAYLARLYSFTPE